MVIFSFKLLNNLRKAIAGRRFPHQLAGGVALGALLGVIPHGNLLALFVLVTVLCFRVNHALLAVVAIAVSFGATSLDPYSNAVGEYLLTHPTGSSLATQAWALPLVPWTDLNNTVVLGSFVIGLASVLPIFFLTLPFFRLVAPAEADEDATSEPDNAMASTGDVADDRSDHAHEMPKPGRFVAAASAKTVQQGAGQPGVPGSPLETKHSVSLLVDQQEEIPPPRFATPGGPSDLGAGAKPATIPIDSVLATDPEFMSADSASDQHVALDQATNSDSIPTNEQMVSIETRIDVIRMRDYRDDASTKPSSESDAENETTQPMDEALNYLLRQLRHSQERKAAG